MSAFRDQERLDGDVRPIIVNDMNFAKPATGEPALLQLRRRAHAVPRVRPRPARAAVGRDLSAAVGHQRAARLRRAALAALRALAGGAGGAAPLRAAITETGEPMPEALLAAAAGGAHLQPGLRHGRIHLLGAGRHRPAPLGRGEDARRRRVRGRRARAHRHAGARSSCATARRISRTSSRAAATRPATTAICGRRCSTPTPSTPSARPATSSTATRRERLHDFIYAAGNRRAPDEAYRAFRGRMPSIQALLKKRGLAEAPTDARAG